MKHSHSPILTHGVIPRLREDKLLVRNALFSKGLPLRRRGKTLAFLARGSNCPRARGGEELR
ncbi:MAG: hypothetical protein BGO67_07595 [Alphaproteobacteria bacterium 41-28]|nr:MAG: hypothetical protein BGO67_07595 [Alphaproteobacteria bacterium 41-28]